MSAIVALGPAARVAGFALAGAVVVETDDEGVEEAWRRVPEDAGLLLLTADAAETLAERLAERRRLLWTVIPE